MSVNDEFPTQDELNGVYYDAAADQYVTFQLDEEHGFVNEYSAFSGALVHEFGRDEFMDEWRERVNFRPVQHDALDNPMDVVESFATDALDTIGNPSWLTGTYDKVSMEFALEVVSYELDENKCAWQEQYEQTEE